MKDVRAYFDRVAPEWDQLREGYFGEGVRREVIDRARLQRETRVADVGCGTGFLAAGLAPLVAVVHCVDASPRMLAQARQNLRAHGNVQFHLGDGTGLPLAAESVDAALANMYLHHLPDPEQGIFEMARILAPGGRLVIVDMDEHHEEWMRAEMADLWLGFPRETVRDWLSRAGLAEVAVESCGQT